MSIQKRFLSIDDLSHLPQPTWAVEGLFEKNSLVMLAGEPGVYKSFMAIDWMLCMATNRKWMDRNTAPGKILYVLGEGKASLLKRLQAWCSFYNLSESELQQVKDNFRVSFDVPQMAMKSSVDNMLSQLAAEQYSPNVIVVDTFARSFVGLDENSQKDTGLWIENADRLRQLGYTVIFLHHTAKNTEFGPRYRGSTAILGAMDTAMIMQKDYQNRMKVVMKVTKQKDHDEGDPLFFIRQQVKPFGQDEEGSMVLVPAPPPIDERFTVEGVAIENAIKKLFEDMTFESDRARARELSRLFPELSETAAQTRVSKKRKEYKGIH